MMALLMAAIRAPGNAGSCPAMADPDNNVHGLFSMRNNVLLPLRRYPPVLILGTELNEAVAEFDQTLT